MRRQVTGEERRIVHPSRQQLEALVDGRLSKSEASEVRAHVDQCAHCREACENHRVFLESLTEVQAEDLPPKARAQADRLYRQATEGKVIDLTALATRGNAAPTTLAADSPEEPDDNIRSLATLYSEDPEVVMRVMHDPARSEDYLQLIADDPGLVSHVLVTLPDIGREYATDDAGRAAIDVTGLDDITRAKWQIKLPQAVFDLEPLEYDPDRTEYSERKTIRTERDDEVEVTFEGKTVGSQITVRLTQLRGRQDFEPVRVIVSHGTRSRLEQAAPGQVLSFDLEDSPATINIRLFD
jgi:hypothetical protein